jgi:hypothetical protein
MTDLNLKKLQEELLGYEEILQWLKANEIFGPHKHLFNSYVEKNFPEQSELSNKVVSQIEASLENNPDFFISLGKALISEIEEINHCLLAFKTEEKTVLEKLKFIKIFWELSRYLRPVATLLTSHRQSLEQLSAHSAVFKHLLQSFGFRKSDVDLVRMIRNSYGHKIHLGKDCIVLVDDEDTNQKIEVALQDIEKIYDNLGNMYSWWSSIFIRLLWTHPQFGCLVLIGFFQGIKGIDSEEFKSRYNTLVSLNPELLKPRNKKKARTDIIAQTSITNSYENLNEIQAKELRDQILLESFFVLNIKLKPFVHFLKVIKPKVNEDSLKPIDTIIELLETLESKGLEFSKNSLQLIHATVALQRSL